MKKTVGWAGLRPVLRMPRKGHRNHLQIVLKLPSWRCSMNRLPHSAFVCCGDECCEKAFLAEQTAKKKSEVKQLKAA